MDKEYEKAAKMINIKVNCEEYIREITEEYCDHNGAEYDFTDITNNTLLQKLLVCPTLEQNLTNRNITIKAFMQHMIRPTLHNMVQHWLTTLPAYNQDAEYPAKEIMNVFGWSELSGTYGHIINNGKSYVWQIEHKMVESITEYFKLANRFFECKQNSKHGEICRAWLRFHPVDIDHLPLAFELPHLDTVSIPTMILNAKSNGEVLFNIAEHLIAKSLDDQGGLIADIEYKNQRDKELKVMMRPKIHHI